MLWRSNRICIEKWLAEGDSELREQRSKDREEEKKMYMVGRGEKPRWVCLLHMILFELCPSSRCHSATGPPSLPSWKVFTSFTTHSLFCPHCSFLYGESECPLSKEPLGLWQVFLEPLSHPLSLPLSSKQLYKRVSCIGLRPIPSIFYSFSLLFWFRVSSKVQKLHHPIHENSQKGEAVYIHGGHH